MLGSAVSKAFSDWPGEVIVTARFEGSKTVPEGQTRIFLDAAAENPFSVMANLPRMDFVINCIGLIKPYIVDTDAHKRSKAVQINTLFPQKLEAWADTTEARIIQIATDCVFSGNRGSYLEGDPHDAFDVYGKSKSLGEIPSDLMMHLRASIIGPEVGRNTSLLEWVRNQPISAKIPGYTDHFWNGVTATHFAQIARGIIAGGLFKSGVQHLVPKGQVSKFELVTSLAKHFGRGDLTIEPTESGQPVNRTLETEFKEFNLALWQSTGFSSPPSIAKMVSDLST